MHFEIMNPQQAVIWHELRPTVGLGYVLYGGTAIALYLGHRQSEDFDFFSETELDQERLESAMPFLKSGHVVRSEHNTRIYRIAVGDDSVTLSFFGGITIGRVGNPVLSSDNNVLLASLDDLMACKAAVIVQREEAKDYKDIAAMCRAGVSLEKGMGSASAMYGSGFSPVISAKCMVWFKDIDLSSLSELDRSTLVEAVDSLDFARIPHIDMLSNVLTHAPAEHIKP
jgi:predicted nucleotidyltransferase